MGNYEKKVTYAEGIYYDKSTELKESIEILKNRNVLRLINNRLIETGVLPKFLECRNLVSYYLIRMDENKYWHTLKPSPYVEKARTKAKINPSLSGQNLYPRRSCKKRQKNLLKPEL